MTGGKAIQADGDALRVTASFCGGKMLAEVEVAAVAGDPHGAAGQFPSRRRSGQGRSRSGASPPRRWPAGAVRFEQWILPEAGDVDITQQEILVAVGRGIQQKDNLEVAEELAQALGGAVCASRPVIDQGWLPATRQVGKSGMTVKPRCFIALGISGAPEHVEGMKDSDLIVAVNTDPKAPIFDVAHYGVVADLLDLVPAPDRKHSNGARRRTAMPTEMKFLGVYGAVWLAVLAGGRVGPVRAADDPTAPHPGPGTQGEPPRSPRPAAGRPWSSEVLFQSRMLRGESIINWAHPAIFWGFCAFVIASALLFVGGIAAPWLHIPQAEEIPVLGTVVDLFAVVVLVGLIASSIRRYILTPPGLQRTIDATIVVSLIALLMVTYLLAEAGGRAKQAMARQAGAPQHGWGQTWLPAGTATARALPAVGLSGRDDRAASASPPGGCTPSSSCSSWSTCPIPSTCTCSGRRWPCSSPRCRTRECSRRRRGGSGEDRRRPENPAGAVHLADAAERLRLRRVRPLRAGLPRGGQRGQALAAAGRPRPEGVRPARRRGGAARAGRPTARRQRSSSAARSRPRPSGAAPPAMPASTSARCGTSTWP